MPYCAQCGKDLAEGEACNCGTKAQEAVEQSVSTEEPAIATESTEQETAQQPTNEPKNLIDQQKFKKFLIIAAAAALVVIGLVVSLCVAGGKGYRKPINRLVKEINKGKKADYVSINMALSTADAREYFEKVVSLNADAYEGEQDELTAAFEDLSDEFGKCKISFKLSDKEKLSKRELKDFQEELRDYWKDSMEDEVDELEGLDAEYIEDYAELFGMSKKNFKKYINAEIKFYKTFKNAKVSAGYKVTGNFLLKDGNDEIDETNNVTLYVLKINGSWAVYSSEDDEYFSFEDTEDKGYELYDFLEEYMNKTLYQIG